MSYYNSHPPLPPGWIPATDPISGNIYYANPSTGETSWQPPPPPPPPPVVPIISTTTDSFVAHIPSHHDNNLQPPVVHSIPHSEPSIQTNISRRLLLVPAARAILNKYNTANTVPTDSSGATESSDRLDPVELYMKAGMISDLVKVQQQYRIEQAEATDTTTAEHDISIQPYEPLKPFELPLGKCVDAVAEKRVDVRLMQLMDELSKI